MIYSLRDTYSYDDPSERWLTNMAMRIRGKFAGGYPEGLVVHYTAGQSIHGDRDAISTVEAGTAKGYAFWCIANNGNMYKTHEIGEWGYHAGVSRWSGLGKNISNKTIGIEVCCSGKLVQHGTEYESWFGEKYPIDCVRHGPDIYGMSGGSYHRFTKEQEKALTDIIVYLVRNSNGEFSIDNVVGHYEISPGRKDDPGWSLSMPMVEYRKFLKEVCNGIKNDGTRTV